jgi:S1-C subfamily serine protease
LKEGDVILEVNGEKIANNLQRLIQRFNIGDKITLKVLSGTQEKTVELTLEELKQ